VFANSLHTELSAAALGGGGAHAWITHNRDPVQRLAGLCGEFDATPEPDLAKVLVLLNQMKTHVQSCHC